MRLPQLHDVRDPEALCQSILKGVLGANGGRWTEAEREDVLQDMRLLIWRLSHRYDPTRTTMTFSTYATWILRKRAGVDAYRTRLVDRRYVKEGESEPVTISLDELMERLDEEVWLEESDHVPYREQSDLLTRLAIVTSDRDPDPGEALEGWLEQLRPDPDDELSEQEAAA